MKTNFLFMLLVLILAELGKADSLLFLKEDNFHNDEKSTNLQSLINAESKIEYDLIHSADNYFELFHTLKGHSDSVNLVIQLKDGRLASASRDTTIKIWDLKTGEAAQTLKGHSVFIGEVIQLKDGTLASASLDNTIKIWDLNTGEAVQTL